MEGVANIRLVAVVASDRAHHHSVPKKEPGVRGKVCRLPIGVRASNKDGPVVSSLDSANGCNQAQSDDDRGTHYLKVFAFKLDNYHTHAQPLYTHAADTHMHSHFMKNDEHTCT